jgi:phosphotransferase system enzyme I (PtsP)
MLVALGYRALSLTPSAVGPVKSMLLELDAEKALATIGPLLDHSETGMTLRQRIETFASSENLQL